MQLLFHCNNGSKNLPHCYVIQKFSVLLGALANLRKTTVSFDLYVRESNENLKIAIKIIYKYLRFSFDSPSYLCPSAWNTLLPREGFTWNLIHMRNFAKSVEIKRSLILYMLIRRILWAPNNANKGPMGFISAFKGLKYGTNNFTWTSINISSYIYLLISTNLMH